MKKILIADNDKTTVDTMAKMILTSKKYKPLKVTSGKQALDKLKKTKVDLLLIDIMMPDMDGITLAEKLYKNRATKNIPVILFSALNLKTAISKSAITKKLFNVKGFLEKPFITRTLIKKIDSVIK